MSVADASGFTVDSLPIADIDSGTSILLTGDDTAALEAVFAALVATPERERSIVLTTEQRGHAVRRSLNQASADADAGSRSTVLAREGRGNSDDISIIDDIADLTGLGMEFSSLVAASQQSVDRFRTGIFLCSTICEEIEDARSVYRFLNSNFLTELRRGDGVGICAFDTSVDLETDVNSMLTGMETSFTARIDVEKTGRKSATLSVSGLAGTDETLEVSL